MIGKTITVGLAIALHCLPGTNALADDATLAIEWNETVLEIADAEDGFLTLKGLRTATMMHIAMHDALNAVDGDYKGYVYSGRSPGADPLVAASEAAFQVASTQYPDMIERFTVLRDKSRYGFISVQSRQSAKQLGEAAAHAILADREGDGWDTEAEYRWQPMAPGVYAEFQEHSATPKGFVFGAGWSKVRGFALDSPDQFRAPPPPSIESERYTRAYNEVKELGRFQSMSRTPDQTHMALWWKDFAENSHNRLARDLIEKEDLSLTEAVRLLALLNMAIFDAYVSSFDNKFHYNHWRPYTAIRWADNDGNPQTVPEKTWTNTHRHTYAFPSYPSAHGMACAAAMTAFEDVFGDEYGFEMRTPMVDVAGPFSGKIEMHPPTRRFASFTEAATQCGRSRVYLGIHFGYDSVEGVRLGKTVGQNVVNKHLRPKTHKK